MNDSSGAAGSAAVRAFARAAGFLVNAPAADVIRLAPPLVISDAQLEAFTRALPDVLDAARVAT